MKFSLFYYIHYINILEVNPAIKDADLYYIDPESSRLWRASPVAGSG